MRKPNFFIIGAPKCGTTSMAAWLSDHAQVYMSPIKEPHFFDTDQPGGINSRRAYERLFRGVTRDHKAVGEASVRYLHSQVAVKNIVEYAPDAHFIVMLRNPVEMAPSLHEQRYFDKFEPVSDFETAWNLQEERARGNSIPSGCIDPNRLQYGSYCRLGEQVSRLLQLVHPERCKFILLDDIKKDVRSVYRSTLDFIGVHDDGRTSFPVVNSAKGWRFPAIAELLSMGVKVKRYIGLKDVRLGIAAPIAKANTVNRSRPSAPNEIRSKLEAYFREDIRTLQSIIQRDLSHWIGEKVE